jgi:hypothetical protein
VRLELSKDGLDLENASAMYEVKVW